MGLPFNERTSATSSFRTIASMPSTSEIQARCHGVDRVALRCDFARHGRALPAVKAAVPIGDTFHTYDCREHN